MSEQHQEQIDNEDLNGVNQDLEEHRDDEILEHGKHQESEFYVALEGEDPEPQGEDPFRGEPAPEWVKTLRKQDRENQRRIKELESELSVHRKPQEVELGEKPTIETVGYDTDELERQLDDWYSKKAQYDQQEQAKKADQEKAQQAWQDRLSGYESAKTELKTKHNVRDYDEAEEVARETLNELQQNIIVMGAKKPHLLIYHLGKNPQKAKELAGITDPIQFAFEAAAIDAQLKVQARKPQTSPERKVAGSGSLSADKDNHLDKLRAKADRTGDSSEVIAYLRAQRNN